MAMQNQKAAKLARKLVTTYKKLYSSNFSEHESVFFHNQIVDPDYEFVQISDEDLEALIDETITFADDLIALYRDVYLDEVRSQILRYIALYRYGGWYFDPDVYLARSLDVLHHHKNVVLIHDETKLASRIVLKFEKRHPLPLNMLRAIVENNRHDLHQFDVEWFSGKRLLTALSTRSYPQEISFLAYDDYVNFPGSVFETADHDRQTDWRILQHFGIREGAVPDFQNMPKRITTEEAEMIKQHVEKFDLAAMLQKLKNVHPVYFREHQILNKFLSESERKSATHLDPRAATMSKAGYKA